MRKKDKPFKIDLGFGDLFKVSPPAKRSIANQLPTYAGQAFAVYTNNDGVIIKHTFKNNIKAQAFREKSKASGIYQAVSDIQFDW